MIGWHLIYFHMDQLFFLSFTVYASELLQNYGIKDCSQFTIDEELSGKKSPMLFLKN